MSRLRNKCSKFYKISSVLHKTVITILELCFFSWTQCILLHRVCRPWYAFAATYPKDLVIMIDNSRSMTSTFDKHSRLYYAIKAAQWVIDTLNPYDHVSMQCSLSIFSQLRETLTCLMNPLFSICVLKALSYYSTWCSR